MWGLLGVRPAIERASFFAENKDANANPLDAFRMQIASVHLALSQNCGDFLGCPSSEGYSILGSILGSPYFGRRPLPSEALVDCMKSRISRGAA